MQDFAKNYIKSYEGLGRWVKFLLNFLWAIPTNLYRLSKSIVKKDTIGAVLSVILLIFCGWWVIAVIDFVTIALKDKIYWFDFKEMKLYALEDSTDSADDNSSSDDKPSSDDNNSNADKID